MQLRAQSDVRCRCGQGLSEADPGCRGLQRSAPRTLRWPDQAQPLRMARLIAQQGCWQCEADEAISSQQPVAMAGRSQLPVRCQLAGAAASRSHYLE